MIVDDVAFMRQMLKDVLQTGGHKIIAEVSSGDEAIRLYKQIKPDLVTMDITMPFMDGIEALTNIKKYDQNAKVIICSAMGQQAMVLNAIMAGAKDFIVKPFQKERVLEAIDKVLFST